MEKRTLLVDLNERAYPIHIGAGLLSQTPALLQEANIKVSQKLFLITDAHVAQHYLKPLQLHLEQAGYQAFSHIVVAGEKAKQFAVYEEVMTAAIEAGLDRKSVVLALGGGVVGDLAGFVAATYMRGIDFVQIPTSLLAHDSSVGGKVAINHRLGKNLIGAFHQPLMVIYDVDTLQTLPRREISAGFAEVIKHGLISDEGFVEWLEEHAKGLMELDAKLVSEAIYRGCAVKAAVVAKDETEQDIRMTLNLGHTFGHAFEALTGYGQLNHGEAISIGMVLAARYAESIGMSPEGVAKRTKRVLAAFGLPTQWPKELHPEDVLRAMHLDKKGVAGTLTLVLPTSMEHVEIVPRVKEEDVLRFMSEEWEESQK
ncbi:3-dehydroquinate synthase [Brevibacillus laterosporus]|uniref:3-dehydroquinate synthase n=1 Tax=Brevibacillus laterosporus TaxID=1465 RepID=UPI003D24F007